MTKPLTIYTSLEEIIENFSFLDDWEDRYGYLIELGRALTPLAPEEKNDANKVTGCVSQVWLSSDNDGEIMHFTGASDAHIVSGLVAIALTIFSGKTASDILSTDEQETFKAIGLEEHLTPQRANGLKSMVVRIKAIAQMSMA
ncbi:MAG: SufE family protein [Rhizobiaceae bacterium]